MKIKKFNLFLEELKVKDLDLKTKQEIIHNFKQRILELKPYWKDEKNNELSIYDKRNILRQFTNEFTEDLTNELNFNEFLEKSSEIFSDKKELNKHINKFLDNLSKV